MPVIKKYHLIIVYSVTMALNFQVRARGCFVINCCVFRETNAQEQLKSHFRSYKHGGGDLST